MSESTEPVAGTLTVAAITAPVTVASITGPVTVAAITAAVGMVSQYPAGATPVAASSGNVAAAVATATLAGAAGRTTYLTGFQVTGSGATAGLPVIVTVTGIIGGTLSYIYTATVGILLPNTPLAVAYAPALAASAVNTSIAVSCPSLGLGNTNNTVVAHGYLL